MLIRWGSDRDVLEQRNILQENRLVVIIGKTLRCNHREKKRRSAPEKRPVPSQSCSLRTKVPHSCKSLMCAHISVQVRKLTDPKGRVASWSQILVCGVWCVVCGVWCAVCSLWRVGFHHARWGPRPASSGGWER